MIPPHTCATQVGREFAALSRPGPRLLCVVQTPCVAAAMARPGTNAQALVKASRSQAGAGASSRSFLAPHYDEWLKRANGPDPTAWMEYDIVDGATDFIFVDCKGANGELDFTSHAYLENTLADSVTGKVPSVSVQISSPDDGDVGALCDLLSRKSPLLLLDSIERDATTVPRSLKGALDAFEASQRALWRAGGSDQGRPEAGQVCLAEGPREAPLTSLE